ncbi:autotransporter domain-containing protein [Sphingomonas sp.]|uniref:autotransporter domain-containing protein n=1 Tax=Sphingomonas sp. TaxID=28214 RepID=UPI001B194A93|nr:autotransporter domain-containing protein [Sphingomonas sp.]MBO9714771.1 autotransporter domain-containing protein [Sphingomonas sp.]
MLARGARPLRSILAIGTCLSGSATALLLAPEAQAQVARAPVVASLGLSSDLPVLASLPAPVAAPSDPTIVAPEAKVAVAVISQAAAALPPAPDYDHGTGTITGSDVVVRVGSVATGNDGERGVDTVATGTTSIEARSVTTTGAFATGIHASGYGDIVIDASQVSTSGFHAFGIEADNRSAGAQSGGITINAGAVSTSGYVSNAVWAASYAGAISITADSVAANGSYSTAVYGSSQLGDVRIDVATVGSAGQGILANSTTTTDITAGDVETRGVGIAAVGGRVSVHAGRVTTSGDNAAAVSAHSNDGAYLYSGAGPRILVDVGTVSTGGYHSDGIDTVNTRFDDTFIYFDSVATSGDSSLGINALATNRAIVVKGGAVSTSGDYATGVVVQNLSSDNFVTVDRITTSGDHSAGVAAFINQGISNNIDVKTITTSGNNSDGVLAVLNGRGETSNVDVGTVYTHGAYSKGVAAYAYGTHDMININAETVVTDGLYADGIYAKNFSVAGNVDITAGTIATLHTSSVGIFAYAYDGNVNIAADSVNGGAIVARTAYGDIHITAGAVNASHYYYSAIKASGRGDIVIEAGTLNGSGRNVGGIRVDGLTVAVDADSITLTGDDARGIIAAGVNQVTIHSNLVRTTGIYSSAIEAGARHVSIYAGDILTYGDHAYGIGASTIAPRFRYVPTTFHPGYYATVSVSGGITTHGDVAKAIKVLSDGGAAVHVGGPIATSGYNAQGVFSVAFAPQTIDGGADIHTSGVYSAGVLSISYGGDITIGLGNITTEGEASAGIYARALDHDGTGMHGLIDIDVKSITTSGEQAAGITAINTTLGGGVSIKADGIATSGDNSVGVLGVSLTSDVSVDVGSVSTAGAKSIGVYAYSSFGNAEVTVGDASTTGDNAGAVVAIGRATLVTAAGDVTTAGDGSAGIYAVSLQAVAKVVANNVSTSGDHASAIRGYAFLTGVDVTTGGRIATTGDQSHGVEIFGNGPLVIVNNGSVTTAGETSHGLYASADAISHAAITVTNAGSVATTGANADTIRVLGHGDIKVASTGTISAKGDNSAGVVAIVTPQPPQTPPAVASGTKTAETVTLLATPPTLLSLNVAAVDVAGTNAAGIVALSHQGDVSITAGKVTALGAGVIGIDVTATTGSATIAIGTLESDGVGLRSSASGNDSVSVSGAVRTPNQIAIELASSAGISSLSVAKGATVVGGGHYDPADPTGAKTGNTIVIGGRTAMTIENAGTIANVGDGYAIFAVDGGTNPPLTGLAISNGGRIEGAVHLTGLADRIVNSGSFVATKDSDFGGGADVFVNSGTFAIGAAATSPGTQASLAASGHSVSMLGLESFQNTGGIVELRNGVAGDTLTLSGNYTGSGSARLGLDLGNGKVDRLVIGGMATGSTTIVLNVDATGATLLAEPMTLVQAGAGSSAAAFSLANAQVGLIDYGMAFDAASGGYRLTSTAGAPVRRLTKIGEGAREIWGQSAAAASAHMTELRDAAGSGRSLWGQTFGSVANHDGPAELAYRQSFYGARIGIDLGGGKRTSFGLTGGYLNARQSFKGGATRATFDTLSFGAYGSLRSGVVFTNLLAQLDHSWIKLQDGTPGAIWTDDASGDTYGAQAELGARFATRGLFVEPVATLAWQHGKIGAITALGQSIDPDDGDAVTGKLGARIGGSVRLGGSEAVLYARGAYVHAFSGDTGLVFRSGGTSEAVAGVRAGDHGEAALGVNLLGKGAWNGFVEGDARFGGGQSGGGGRVGLRLAF